METPTTADLSYRLRDAATLHVVSGRSMAPPSTEGERRGRTAALGRGWSRLAFLARRLAWGLLAGACVAACSIDDRGVSAPSDNGDDQQTGSASTAGAGGTNVGENVADTAAQGAGTGGERPAASGDIALPGPTPECDPGSTRCISAQQVAECGADGAWAAPVGCSYICSDGACAGECVPGSLECLSAVRYRACSDEGVWSTPSDCENACIGSACAGECRPGQTRCASSVDVATCSNQGAWGAPAACDNACVDDACTGECSPGTTRCSSETDVQTCGDAGQWQPPAACEYACLAGACGGECTPGNQRCNPNSGVPQFCSTEGLWQSREPCAFVCSGSGTCGGECVPGTNRCNANGVTPQVCNDDGVWQNGDRCPFVCSGSGQCTGDCTPGARRCSPDTGLPELCDENGTWQAQSACRSGQTCAAGECLPCQDDGACRLYSCGCTICGVLGLNEPEPPCDRQNEVCIVAACNDRFAICLEGACFLE